MSSTAVFVLTVIGIGFTVVNLIILALTLKLYTEIFKARDQRRS